tara:strand:+ start:54 stop:260 length:207 start_codon:yes stop_codon:yes gene_type:complete
MKRNKPNRNIVFLIFSVVLGCLVGFWIVTRALRSTRRRKRLGDEAATFDFYVEPATPVPTPDQHASIA